MAPERRANESNAENTIFAVKRLMGRKFEDPEVQRHLLACPYDIVAAPNGDAHVRVRGRDFSPPEISALVLNKMRQTAEDWIGGEVTEQIQGVAIAMTMEATEEDLFATVFPHPTMSEAMHEASLDAYGRVLHI